MKNSNVAQVVFRRVASAAALVLALVSGASSASAESYDEEGHRIVAEVDVKVNK